MSSNNNNPSKLEDKSAFEFLMDDSASLDFDFLPDFDILREEGNREDAVAVGQNNNNEDGNNEDGNNEDGNNEDGDDADEDDADEDDADEDDADEDDADENDGTGCLNSITDAVTKINNWHRDFFVQNTEEKIALINNLVNYYNTCNHKEPLVATDTADFGLDLLQQISVFESRKNTIHELNFKKLDNPEMTLINNSGKEIKFNLEDTNQYNFKPLPCPICKAMVDKAKEIYNTRRDFDTDLYNLFLLFQLLKSYVENMYCPRSSCKSSMEKLALYFKNSMSEKSISESLNPYYHKNKNIFKIYSLDSIYENSFQAFDSNNIRQNNDFLLIQRNLFSYEFKNLVEANKKKLKERKRKNVLLGNTLETATDNKKIVKVKLNTIACPRYNMKFGHLVLNLHKAFCGNSSFDNDGNYTGQGLFAGWIPQSSSLLYQKPSFNEYLFHAWYYQLQTVRERAGIPLSADDNEKYMMWIGQNNDEFEFKKNIFHQRSIKFKKLNEESVVKKRGFTKRKIDVNDYYQNVKSPKEFKSQQIEKIGQRPNDTNRKDSSLGFLNYDECSKWNKIFRGFYRSLMENGIDYYTMQVENPTTNQLIRIPKIVRKCLPKFVYNNLLRFANIEATHNHSISDIFKKMFSPLPCTRDFIEGNVIRRINNYMDENVANYESCFTDADDNELVAIGNTDTDTNQRNDAEHIKLNSTYTTQIYDAYKNLYPFDENYNPYEELINELDDFYYKEEDIEYDKMIRTKMTRFFKNKLKIIRPNNNGGNVIKKVTNYFSIFFDFAYEKYALLCDFFSQVITLQMAYNQQIPDLNKYNSLITKFTSKFIKFDNKVLRQWNNYRQVNNDFNYESDIINHVNNND